MTAFLLGNLDYIFFIYGLSFINLGVVCVAMGRLAQPSALPWRWLAVFGFAHGGHEWLSMVALSLDDVALLAPLRLAALVVSYLALLEFARATCVQDHTAVVTRWIYLPIAFVLLVGGWFGGSLGVEVAARYSLCLIGAGWSAVVLLQHARIHTGVQRHTLKVAALAMGIYALVSGGIVPAMPFGPAALFNQDTFLAWFGVPVQLLRMVLASVMALTLWLYSQYGFTHSGLKHRRNFYLGLSFAILTLILVFGWKFTDTLGVRFLEHDRQDSGEVITLLGERINGYKKSIRGLAITLSSSPLLLSALNRQALEEINPILDQYLAADDTLVIYIMGSDGAVLSSSNRSEANSFVGQNYRFRSYFQEALSGRVGVESSVGVTSKQAGLYVAVPVVDGHGKIMAVAVIKKTLSAESLGLAKNVSTFVVDRAGAVLVSGATSAPRRLWPTTAEPTALLPHEPADGEWLVFDGRKMIAMRGALATTGWEVVILADASTVGVSRLFAIITVLVIATVFLFSMLLLQREMANALRLDELVLARELILNSVGDGIVGIDAKGCIQFVNPAALRLLGYDEKELLGEKFHSLNYFNCWVGDEARGCCANCYTDSREIRKERWRETYLVNKQNDPIQIEYVCTTSGDSLQGRVVVLAFHDITERKQMERRLRDQSAFLGTLLGSVPVPVFYKDTNGYYLGANQAFEDLVQKPQDEIVGKRVSDLASAEIARECEARDAALYEHKGLQVYEGLMQRWDGQIRNVVFHQATFRNADGVVDGLIGAILDITERKQVEDRLRLAASVFSNAQEGILITDAERRIVDVNPGFTQITGYEWEEVLGRSPRLLQSDTQDAAFHSAMWQTIQETGAWHGEIVNRRKTGELYPVILSVNMVTGEDDTLRHYVGIFSDITELKAREADLERIAYYDPLTGVPNRRLLVDRLSQALAYAQRTQQSLAVCYLDLDGFKPVNDQWGHEAGDRLLVEITKRLQGIMRATDTLARLGGDEFALLLGAMKHDADCHDIRERMLAAIEIPFLIHEQAVSVSASIGVTLYPRDDADAGSLLRHADHAMYQAKESGRRRFCVYDPEHNREIQSTRKQRQRLAEALQDQEFVLFYQPKVHLVSGIMVGSEALIRWQHPERGILAPGEFLPLMAGSDLEVPLGEWVIETALRQIAVWKMDGLPLRVSVNIGAHHLQQPNFTDRLQAILEKHPEVSADNLELEILESSAVDDLRRVSQVLVDCKRLGVHFSLDDFGTGYSSLSYFRELPVETLKIDQSFVREMLDNSDDLSIVESIIHLARTLKRSVIAEGIESAAHAAALVKLGCFYGQGYAIARPMPAEALLAWLTRWRENPALGRGYTVQSMLRSKMSDPGYEEENTAEPKR